MRHVCDVVDQLRGTLGRLELALSLLEDAVVWTDADGVIQWCNPSFDRLVERSHTDILGAPIAEVLPIERDGCPVHDDESPFAVADGQASAGVFDLDCLQVEVTARRTARPEEMVVAAIHIVSDGARSEDKKRELLEQLEAASRELEAFASSAAEVTET